MSYGLGWRWGRSPESLAPPEFPAFAGADILFQYESRFPGDITLNAGRVSDWADRQGLRDLETITTIRRPVVASGAFKGGTVDGIDFEDSGNSNFLGLVMGGAGAAGLGGIGNADALICFVAKRAPGASAAMRMAQDDATRGLFVRATGNPLMQIELSSEGFGAITTDPGITDAEQESPHVYIIHGWNDTSPGNQHWQGSYGGPKTSGVLTDVQDNKLDNVQFTMSRLGSNIGTTDMIVGFAMGLEGAGDLGDGDAPFNSDIQQLYDYCEHHYLD